jgi:HSP20 family protein
MTWNNKDPFDEIIEKIFKQLRNDSIFTNNPDIKSWSYGFTMTQGPDGRPSIREFGQKPFQDQEQLNIGVPTEEEILTQVDVDTNQNKVRIIAEIPGVTKEDIKINATENKVLIKAQKNSQVIFKELPLEIKINPETANASYNNGILDLTIEIQEENQGKDIKIN